MAKLMSDEFSPKEYFAEEGVRNYWSIPKGVVKSNNLSLGAKLLYGVIFGLAYDKDECYASYKTLRKHLSNPSQATVQRWLKELYDARLVRPIHRGRGISNLYRMLKSPLVGNMTDEEYEEGLKFVYTGPYTEDPVLVDELTSIQYYYCELRDWVNKSVRPDDYPMPKRQFKAGPHEKSASEDARWEVIDRYLFQYNPIPGVPYEIECDLDVLSVNPTTTEWVIPDDKD